MHLETPVGIDGLEGREPIPVKAATGFKGGPTAFPRWKNRFHLLYAEETDNWCDFHPAYTAFNMGYDVDGVDNKNPKQPKQIEQLKRRTMLRGNLFHAYASECHLKQRKAYVLPDHKRPPGRRPTCVGNGTVAIRFTDGEFKEIKCPGKHCMYVEREKWKDNKGRYYVPCSPFVKLIFRLRFLDDVVTVDGERQSRPNPMPAMMCKFTSGGWDTAANLEGFFKQIERAAQRLGIENPILFGLPFVMTLYEKTKAETHSRWPVVKFTPECDLLEFFLKTQKQIAQLGTKPPEVPMIETHEGSDAVLASDARDLMLRVPSQ